MKYGVVKVRARGARDRRTHRIIQGRVRTGSHRGADGDVDGAAGSEQGGPCDWTARTKRTPSAWCSKIEIQCGTIEIWCNQIEKYGVVKS